MWYLCFAASVAVLVLSVIVSGIVNFRRLGKKRRFHLLNALLAGVFLAAVLMFFPIHYLQSLETGGAFRALLLSVFNSMQIFPIGCEFAVVHEGTLFCNAALKPFYEAWAALLFVLAPLFTFGFVLSLFKNVSAYTRYYLSFFRRVYVFSELNERSLALAGDIKRHDRRATVIFTDVFESNEERSFELLEEAKKLRAICFKNDLLAVNLGFHLPTSDMYFFAIGEDETENLNQSVKLIGHYRDRRNTHAYVFSTKIEGELILSAIDKGEVKVRRVNEVESLINRLLYERGSVIFESAKAAKDGMKHINAVIVGLGRYGTEMLKALAWFGQMDGYKLEIHAFDEDPLAEDKLTAAVPELMSPDYNGRTVEGEAQYKITVHAGMRVGTDTFVKALEKLTDTTYVIVALGNDEVNIAAAVDLRMRFERMRIHPLIQAIVYNSQKKKALAGIKNFKGQAYNVEFIGDMESSYAQDVILGSELERKALERHLKWGREEDFWDYEYNYRSSVASAIHMKARIECGIPGAAKTEGELTGEEADALSVLEHRRWNAYMRAEGYVFSGSKEKSSRNDLGKMHHDLVEFQSLADGEDVKDKRIATF